jgi:hypothetical protein
MKTSGFMRHDSERMSGTWSTVKTPRSGSTSSL